MSNLVPLNRDRLVESLRPNHGDRRLVLAVVIVMLGLAMLAVQSSTKLELKLPPAEVLIRQLQSACRDEAKRAGQMPIMAVIGLAQAQTYGGDFAGAKQTAQSLSGDWGSHALSLCWQRHFELTAQIGDFPADPGGEWNSGRIAIVLGRIDAAKHLAKAGRLAEATAFLPTDDGQDRGIADFLSDFHLVLAEAQVRQGNRTGAAASLKQSWDLLQRLPEGHSRRMEWMMGMAQVWLEMQDRDQARAVVEAAVQVIRNRTSKAHVSTYLAIDSARVGQLWSRLGEGELSREAFRGALRSAEAADQEERGRGFGNAALSASQHARVVSQIAAREFSAGWQTEAAETYEIALAALEQIDDVPRRDFPLSDLLETQMDVGHETAVQTTLRRMKTAYWRSLGHCKCARKLVVTGQMLSAKQHLEQAEAFAQTESSARNQADLFEKIAGVKAKTGDTVAARHWFGKALEISLLTDDRIHHQAVAHAQVEAGLWEDAYRTIQQMPQAEFRLLPLSQLALQVAKKEAHPRQDAIKK